MPGWTGTWLGEEIDGSEEINVFRILKFKAMKKIYMFLLTVTIAAVSIAQVPDKMSYQAVIRDTEGNLVTEQEIGMQISILQGSANGAAVYVETQSPTTNVNGLVSIEIGGDDGTAISGNFASIDWSAGPYFIKTETDPSGGINYTITGTSQLLSVPYALHSGSSDVLTGEISESQISDLQNYLTEETDPLFDASPAAGIEGADIGNWNEAHGWGDHAEENYLISEEDPIFTSTFDFEDVEDGDLLMYDATAGKWVRFTPDYISEYIETDPIFEASPAADIEADDIDNWDEAYGWGNHAEEGYLDTETDPVFAASVAGNITQEDIERWNAESEFDVMLSNLSMLLHLPFSEGLQPAGSIRVIDHSAWRHEVEAVESIPGNPPSHIRNSKAGQTALYFDGSNELRVSPFYNDDVLYDPFTSANIYGGPLTITAWVRPDLIDSEERYVFTDGSSSEGYVRLSPGSVNYRFGLSEFSYSTTIIPDQWYHVALVSDRPVNNDQAVFSGYLNGILVYESEMQSCTGNCGPGNELRIGVNFVGIIDDLRIYNKALSAGEIQAIF